MSAYEWLDLATISDDEIFERIALLEESIRAATRGTMDAVRDGDREKLQYLIGAKRIYGEWIDQLHAEQERRAGIEPQIAAGEHPPALFELEA